MDELTQQFINNNHTAINLAIALLLGALIGLERGWVARDQKAGERIAGVRTYGLIGLLGGVSALLSQAVTLWAFPAMFIGIVAISLVAFQARIKHFPDYSITSLVGLLLTFCYGAIAVAVDPTLAAAAAVITAIILDNKREIHGLVNKLHAHELDAGLKLLLITVVMLPILPNRGVGPGAMVNPYEIWWMVVLIASVSFIGYFAVRVGGTEKGILFTSLFAGLSSSTALTLHYARQSRQSVALSPLLASGVLLACGTMFPRILLYCAVISPSMLPKMVWPAVVMTLLLYVPALLIWRAHKNGSGSEAPHLTQNPLDLKVALMFGALLTIIMVLGDWLREWLGTAGIYLLAASSGIADVDAITLSLTRMSTKTIDLHTAVFAVVLAASVNNAVKATMAAVLGHRQLATRVAGPMALSLMAGLWVAWGV
ncbi:MgtC/SapB family protein [Marinobacter caseinilyticus]|uniref:MgtC/SapB family protein n=1 Tax=Marinobacter caseinilyticus TaxID=2692195 RepID=UPI00140C317F|nr:MgtC/SapB family protein [Marinobacter caseinilyticus]